jgi:hypothetical protein
MNREHVAKTWTFRGLSDLFFAFDNDDVAFEDNAVFSEIMGLEKFLKAVLLYQRHAEYELLEHKEARVKLNIMAMNIGHRFDTMLTSLSDGGLQDVDQIKRMTFDGYEGSKLIYAVEKGYMETRYPVPEPVSDNFPIAETGFTHDPLSSSGITKFIYALCNACFYELSRKVDFKDMLGQFREVFQHRESFTRFNNCFWEARCKRGIPGTVYLSKE